MATAKATDKGTQEKAAERGKKKVDAFKKLGVKRVPKAVDAITRVTALANTRSYSYDNSQREKIFNAIDSAVAKMKQAFTDPVAAAKNDFAL